MRFTLAAALALIALVLPSFSFAAGPCGSGFGGNAWLYPGYWYNVYGMESIPYFSLHPPVYYSQPVPRTYGWSPFAYPPGTMTPEVEMVQPQMVRNPHAGQVEAAESDRIARSAPVRIFNPYVEDSRLQLSQSE